MAVEHYVLLGVALDLVLKITERTKEEKLRNSLNVYAGGREWFIIQYWTNVLSL